MEFYATAILLLSISAALAIISAIVSAILKLFGLPFFKNFKRGLWSLLIFPTLLLYGNLIERNLTNVEEVEINSDKVPASFDGYRIVQISDIHLRSYENRRKRLQKTVDEINALNPDVILSTGDLVSLNSSELDFSEDILRKLEANDGVYSILGNHDYSHYNRDWSEEQRREDVASLIRRQRGMGWHLLLNENRQIIRGSDTISIIGVENTSAKNRFRSSGNLPKAIEGSKGSYKILLTHDPSHWRAEVLDHPDIDLTLSGHTHGMQSSLFGWSIISLLYDEYKGLYKEGEQLLYVNIGLGETMFPFRIGAPPEITLFTLRSTRHP
ncbi:MAG: metallophosphoesterase [Bacteroidales bacterium]|nr:metallophosphoesterase [Bacteroidales bacterium]